jgi:ApbE superfamily uncharacterized protein (UPF0280 family)
MGYEPRIYRHSGARPDDLVSFQVCVLETDLLVLAGTDLSAEARQLVIDARRDLEVFIARVPRFAESWMPVDVPADAPPIVRAMADAAALAGVGPMAAVAGAMAEHVARGLAPHTSEVIVENGGDDFLVLEKERIVGIEAGASPLSGKVGLRISPGATPLGIATSSGTVGPSVSLGRADAVTVLAASGALADAAATTAGNVVHGPSDIDAGLAAARGVRGVLGVVIIAGEAMGAWGDVDLMRL